MIVLIRSKDIDFDPRCQKYIKFLEEQKLEHCIIDWPRKVYKLSATQGLNYFRFSLHYRFEAGGYIALAGRFMFFLFCVRILYKIRKKIFVIHGCDLDGVIPGILFKLYRPKAKVIFDVFDWFSDTLHNLNGFIKFILKISEHFALQHSNHIIVCEDYRVNQITKNNRHKTIVFKNVPENSYTNFSLINTPFPQQLPIVSYVGGFVKERGLHFLLQLAKDRYINLLIAGYGDNKIEEEIEEISKQDNVSYYGRVEYELGLEIMKTSECIFAFYELSNPNHFYAAPNKFYESLFLGKSIITNEGTKFSENVFNLNVGFVIKNSYEELVKLIQNISNLDLHIHKTNGLKIWENEYSDYTRYYLENIYLNILKN